MINISDIIDGLEKDVDFKNSQKLFKYFRGEEISPFKYRILNADEDFADILFRETGVKEGWNASTIKSIKAELTPWLNSLVRTKESFNGIYVTKYIAIADRFFNWLDNPKVKLEEIGNFENLFKPGTPPEKIQAYLKILQIPIWPQGLGQLVNEKWKWIGDKGAARVYFEELERATVVIGGLDKRTVARLMENRFTNYKASRVSKSCGNTAESYRPFLTEQINKI